MTIQILMISYSGIYDPPLVYFPSLPSHSMHVGSNNN